jgi:fucose permease
MKSDRNRLGKVRKSRESALLLPIFGFLALVPPIIGLFADEYRIFGVPLIVLYMFVVWLLLIVSAQRLSSRLSDD